MDWKPVSVDFTSVWHVVGATISSLAFPNEETRQR